jgi:miniconductance mechanosensitive channel
MVENVILWLNNKILFTVFLLIILSILLFRGMQFVIARTLYFATIRSKNIYDDLIVDRLQPFRIAWIFPLGIIYYYSNVVFGDNSSIQLISLLLIIWVLVDFSISLLSGINDVYKHNPRYTGNSVTGFFGVLKVLIVIVAIVFNVILLFDVQPGDLVAGVGAWLAVLLLIFRDTILSFVASVQISSQVLIKEGDMIEVSAFNTFGLVTEVNLRTIVIKNFDNTITNVPTDKIIDTGFKNYRMMLETKARRMQRSISLDLFSIKFCDMELLEKLARYDMITDYANQQIQAIKEHKLEKKAAYDFPLDGPQITNLQLYSHYAEAYLKNRKDVRLKGYFFLLRTLEPGPKGLPFEIYLFIKAGSWPEFEAIQTEIMNHLIAALPYFELKPYQIMDVDL